MPNWCSNSVVCTADENTLNEIKRLFREIDKKKSADGNYHLPDFAKSEGFMTDIEVVENRITYESRWVPNTELLMEIADFYQADFVSRFNEMSNGLYGEASYDRTTLKTVYLDQDDPKVIRYDKVKNGYPYGEDVFEYEGDLLDYILDQKMQQNFDVNVYTVTR